MKPKRLPPPPLGRCLADNSDAAGRVRVGIAVEIARPIGGNKAGFGDHDSSHEHAISAFRPDARCKF